MIKIHLKEGVRIASLVGIAACTPAVRVETPMPVTAPAVVLEASDMEVRATAGLTWTDLVVPGFPSGAKIAVLHGNPGTSGDYTLRLQFPDGYEFPLHWHPNGEHLTVLTGSFHLGMEGAASVTDYAPGDFLYIPGHHAHFGGARGMTVIQLHGNGPFAINIGSGK